jgi:hypothetical protein
MMRNKKRLVRAKDVIGVQAPDTLVLGTFAYSHLDRTCNYEKNGIAGLAFGEDPYLRY